MFTMDKESEQFGIRNYCGLELQYFKLVEHTEFESKLKKAKDHVDIAFFRYLSGSVKWVSQD